MEFVELTMNAHFKKMNRPGVALCTLCDRSINYQNRGLAALKLHSDSKLHVRRVKEKATNVSLDVHIEQNSSEPTQQQEKMDRMNIKYRKEYMLVRNL